MNKQETTDNQINQALARHMTLHLERLGWEVSSIDLIQAKWFAIAFYKLDSAMDAVEVMGCYGYPSGGNHWEITRGKDYDYVAGEPIEVWILWLQLVDVPLALRMVKRLADALPEQSGGT